MFDIPRLYQSYVDRHGPSLAGVGHSFTNMYRLIS